MEQIYPSINIYKNYIFNTNIHNINIDLNSYFCFCGCKSRKKILELPELISPEKQNIHIDISIQ